MQQQKWDKNMSLFFKDTHLSKQENTDNNRKQGAIRHSVQHEQMLAVQNKGGTEVRKTTDHRIDD